MKRGKVKCESCFLKIGILHLKIPRTCVDCSGHFCTDCTVHVERSLFDRRCRECSQFLSGGFTRSSLKNMRMKSILSFLKRRRINFSGCADKSDLVDLVCQVYKIPWDVATFSSTTRPLYSSLSDNSNPMLSNSVAQQISVVQTASFATLEDDHQSQPSFPPTSCNETISNVESAAHARLILCNPTDSPVQEPSTSGAGDRCQVPENKYKDMVRVSLALLEDIGEIDLLSVNQLKQLLAANHMQVAAGCREKEELRQQVRMLFKAEQRRMRQNNSEETIDWTNTCKICMSTEIDCVLLDCGHLCCCLDCGKTLAECPMCRALVVRTLRVFKS